MLAEETYLSLAYRHDGTLEGLLSAIFQTYARHESPDDIAGPRALLPRLGQYVADIETNVQEAMRVKAGIVRAGGHRAFKTVRLASASDDPDIGTHINRFVHHAMELDRDRPCRTCPRTTHCTAYKNDRISCPRVRRRLIDDISHPAVEPVHKAQRTMSNEREHLLQFLRFSHLEGGLWYARCSPKGSLVPLVMNHFVGRFNVQPFIINDVAHDVAGVYDGERWYLVDTAECGSPETNLPPQTPDEAIMRDSWQRFYRAVSIDARYNPELRRHFMPVRFWKDLPELEGETGAFRSSRALRESHRVGLPTRQAEPLAAYSSELPEESSYGPSDSPS